MLKEFLTVTNIVIFQGDLVTFFIYLFSNSDFSYLFIFLLISKQIFMFGFYSKFGPKKGKLLKNSAPPFTILHTHGSL